MRLRHFLSLALDYFAAKINDKLNDFKNENTREVYIKLLEIQKSFRFVRDRIDMLNRLYFKDAQINLKECVFDKVDNKVNELIEIKTLFAEVRKLMPELNLEQINQSNVDSNEDILKLLDSNLDKVSR